MRARSSQPRSGVWGVAAAGLTVLLPAACFDPEVTAPDCVIRCEQECPTGMVCSGGYCVAEGHEGVCEGGKGGTEPVPSRTAGAAGVGGDYINIHSIKSNVQCPMSNVSNRMLFR